jgi:hypothetical protein
MRGGSSRFSIRSSVALAAAIDDNAGISRHCLTFCRMECYNRSIEPDKCCNTFLLWYESQNPLTAVGQMLAATRRLPARADSGASPRIFKCWKEFVNDRHDAVSRNRTAPDARCNTHCHDADKGPCLSQSFAYTDVNLWSKRTTRTHIPAKARKRSVV